MKKLFLILVIILWASQVWGATYYVKSGGNDSLNGLSDATAWATIAKVQATVTSGDTIYFRSQDTWTSATPPVLTATAGVTYDGSTYGSGTRAILKATGDHDDDGVVSIHTGDINHPVVFKGFEVHGNSKALSGISMGGYYETDFSHVTVDNCVVHDAGSPGGYGHRGIYIGTIGGSNHTVSNITVKNTTVYNITYGGIVVYPTWARVGHKVDTVLIQNCTVYNTGTVSDGEGIYIKNDVANITVEFCNLYGNSHGVHLETVEDTDIGTIVNATIRYNIIHDNIYSGINFMNRARRITANYYSNILYDNGKSPAVHSANIYMNDTDFSTSTINFYNNTLSINNANVTSLDPKCVSIGDGQTDAGGVTGTPTINFKNNIIYTSNCLPIVDVNNKLTHSNNLIYRSSGNTAAHVISGTTTYDRDGTYAGLTNWEATAKKTAPTFAGGTLPTGFTGTYGRNLVPNTNYFSITSGDAHNNGATLGSPYNGCINGAGLSTPITRPQGAGYDIGAYEYVESVPVRLSPPHNFRPAGAGAR